MLKYDSVEEKFNINNVLSCNWGGEEAACDEEVQMITGGLSDKHDLIPTFQSTRPIGMTNKTPFSPYFANEQSELTSEDSISPSAVSLVLPKFLKSPLPKSPMPMHRMGSKKRRKQIHEPGIDNSSFEFGEDAPIDNEDTNVNPNKHKLHTIELSGSIDNHPDVYVPLISTTNLEYCFPPTICHSNQLSNLKKFRSTESLAGCSQVSHSAPSHTGNLASGTTPVEPTPRTSLSENSALTSLVCDSPELPTCTSAVHSRLITGPCGVASVDLSDASTSASTSVSISACYLSVQQTKR